MLNAELKQRTGAHTSLQPYYVSKVSCVGLCCIPDRSMSPKVFQFLKKRLKEFTYEHYDWRMN